MGVLATYTAYILIQFYRRYPSIRDVVDVARIMGGKPLQIIVGLAHVLNLCLICASANVTLSIALNTMTEHALCTVGFIGIPMIMCWLLCMPRSLSFAGYFGIGSTISICESAANQHSCDTHGLQSVQSLSWSLLSPSTGQIMPLLRTVAVAIGANLSISHCKCVLAQIPARP